MSQVSGQKIKIGLIQLLVEGGEPQRNVDRAVEWVARAADEGCDIALLPEVLDLGWTHPSAWDEAEPVPGKWSDILAATARERGIFICAGLTEADGDKVFNAAVLIDDSGEIILKYRKINILDVGQEFYAIGDSLGVVDTRFGRIGVDICSDNYHDSLEIGHVLSRMGAQLILSPSAWTSDYHYTEDEDPYGRKWFGPYHHIAELFDVLVVGCTSVGYIVGGPYEGKKMVGNSLVVGQAGALVKGRKNEFATDLVVAEVEIPTGQPKGTDIGKMLTDKGYYSH